MPLTLRLIILITCAITRAKAQNIETIAGNGMTGYSGDNLAATTAQLNKPFGLATAANGDLYIADRYNNVIRKVSATGIITTIAGNGTAGYNGDGKPATAAMQNNITGVAVDASGNIFIADKSNNRIRRVDAAGIITTIAGTGVAGYSGDNSPATLAQVNLPRNIATDTHGNLYIADAANHRVRKVGAAGIITTIAGTGVPGYNGDNIPAAAAQLYGPYDVAAAENGDIIIADVDNERIRKISPAGMITTIAGTGTPGYSGDEGQATAAMLYEPISVDMDRYGNVYIADAWNQRIRKIYTTGIITTIAGTGAAGYSVDNGPATAAQVHDPYGIAVGTDGDIFISDDANDRVRMISYAEITAPAIRVWPNPSRDFQMEISCPAMERAQVTITALNGSKAVDLVVPTNSIFAFSPDIAPGIYIVTAVTTAGTMHKIIVLANK